MSGGIEGTGLMLNTFGDGQRYYANWKRLGDHLHSALGDIEVECPECGGDGRVETEKFNRTWAVYWRTCERCGGRGTYWRERTEEE